MTNPLLDVPAGSKKKEKKIGKGLMGFFKKTSKNKLLMGVVVVPTLLSAIYFGVFASNVYVSESSFVIRSPRTQGSLSGLGALLQGAGFSRSQDDTFTVQEFMRSRDALSKLNGNLKLKEHFSSSNIDFINRFNALGFGGQTEDLYRYFQDKFSIEMDSSSSITILKSKAFSPEMAQNINESFLSEAETLINQLNDRARNDLVAFSEKDVKESAANVKKIADQLNGFRIKNGVFDLQQQTKVQLQLVSKLQDELIAIKTQKAQVIAVTPKNPQIPSLNAREASVRKEIAAELGTIAGVGNASFSNKAAEFERLSLESKMAEQQYAASLASMESAKNEIQRKQLYLERVAQPNLPDMAREPQRILNIFTTFVLGLIIYGILRLLISSVKEHQD